MDSSEFVKHLGSGDASQVLEGGDKTKCVFLTHVFCGVFVNCNLWVLERIHSMVKKIESSKKNGETILEFINLLKHLRPRNFNILLDVTKKEVDEYLYLNNAEGRKIVDKYREVFTPEGYDLFVLLETFIKDGEQRLQESITLLKYILGCKNSVLFSSGGNNDIVWIIYDLLLTLSPNDKIDDYVGYARDLFFYKIKKNAKYRIERLPILFNSLIVVATKKVRYRSLGGVGGGDRMSYLYVLTECDYNKLAEVQDEKRRMARLRPSYKSLVVNSKEYEKIERMRSSLAIIKSNQI